MLSQRLKMLREERGLLQSDIAKLLNITSSAYGYYEQGKREPKPDALLLLANLYEVSTDYLLGKTNNRNATSRLKSQFDSMTNENKLHYWISKTGLSYVEVAEKVGISESRLEDYRSGYMEPPLEGLAKLCNVSTDCLLGFREKSRPARPDGSMPFRFDPEIPQRLKSLAQQMDETYGAIADQLGIEENEAFNFFEYGFVPHISIFTKIVEHYLVSSDYLLNLSNSTMTVRPDEEELLKTYRALTEKNKVRGLSRLYDLEEAQSAVAATDHYLDDQEKSLPSSGTEGNLVG